MTISPPSDIVLDVARAADPVQVRQATMRLAAGAPAVDAEAFEALFAPAQGYARTPARFNLAEQALMRLDNNRSLHPSLHTSGAQHGRTDDVAEDFEAMALTQFVTAMLPQNGEAVFGTGTAGQIFKSMLAEQIAYEMAAAGGIGIAEMLRQDLPTPVPAVAEGRSDNGKEAADALARA